MIDTIFSLIGGFKGLITGALGLLGGLWVLWTKRQNAKLKEENEQRRQAERVYQAKDRVRQHDITQDYNREQRIDEVRGKVDHATSQSEAADAVSGAINTYFGDNK